MRIYRPDWVEYINKAEVGCAVKALQTLEGRRNLDQWFTERVEPINEMLEGAVEIYQDSLIMDSLWDTAPEKGAIKYSRKALLINIEPIKKDTVEDILRDFVRQGNMLATNSEPWSDKVCALHSRAKKLLGDV